MGKLEGAKIMLAVWTAGSPGSYKPVGCLTQQGVNRSAEKIDTSSKCDDGYGSSLPGRKSIDMPIAGVAEFAPAAGSLGYSDLVDWWNDGVEKDFKIYQTGGGSDFTPQYGTGVLL